MSWYCDVAPGHPVHRPYHDEEYGFPLADDNALFERLSLEIFQAGLSWLLVLNKRPGLVRAFAGFEIARVAGFGDDDVARLLADAAIIRNRRKVAAIIDNARRLEALRAEYGGFASWLDTHHPRPLAAWVKLFRSRFAFMGEEVVKEFLLSIGYLPGAHRPDCPVFAVIARHDPPWTRGGAAACRD